MSDHSSNASERPPDGSEVTCEPAGPCAAAASTFRRRRGVYPGLLVAAAVLLGLINLARLDHLTSDQMSVGTMALQKINPELFTSSILHSSEQHYSFYLPWYRTLVTTLCRWTGSVQMAYWTLMFVTTVTMMFSLYLLFRGLGIGPPLAFLGGVIGSLPRLSLGNTMWGAAMIETALPRTLFCIGFPLVVLLLFRNSFRGWSLPLAFLGVGLLGNLHPQSGLFAACVLGPLLLIVRRFRPMAWLQTAVGGICALAGITPFLVASAWWMPRLRAIPMTSVSEAITLNKLSSMATGVLTANILPKLLVTGSCVFPVLVAVFLCARWLPLCRNRSLQISVHATVVIIALCVAAVLMKNTLMWVWTDWPTKITWMRASRFIHFFGVLAVVLFLAESAAEKAWRWKLQKVVLIGLTLVPVAASACGLELVFRGRFQPFRETAEWAAATPVGTRFLVDAYPAIAFRLWSQRPVAIAEHDVQFFFIGSPDKADEAAEFSCSISNLYSKREWEALRDLARAEDIPYVVGPPEMQTAMAPVFERAGGPWIFASSTSRMQPVE